MDEKLIKVYFGQDLLPYKDSERSVHFPIVGGAFLGASNTTKIRFYFDRIGDTSATYVSVAKLPNGKQGSKVLPIASDENGNYAELELSNWYTQAKGDVYIALQGYQGGVEYEYDSETELYEIHGTPTIQTTGSIKLAINYAPIGQVADYNDEFTTYQEILAALGDKIGIENGIVSVELTSILTTDELLNNGAIGLNKPFVLDNMGETLLCYISEDSGTYTLKVIGKDSAYTCTFTSSVLVRNLLSESVLDISYLPVINLTNAMQTLTSSELEIANQDNSIIKYNGRVYHKANETTDSYEFVSTDYDISDIGANNQITKYEISVNRASGSTVMLQQFLNIYSVGEIDALLSSYYTKTEIDNQLATKQDRLVSGTNIKTLTVDGVEKSLLGSGTIEVGTGSGGSAEWGAIGGDIQDQTDLQNELQDIREVAEGKCKSWVLSYLTKAPTTNSQAQALTKPDGTHFTNLADFTSYVSELELKNSSFNTQDNYVDITGTFDYLITYDNVVYKVIDLIQIARVGDVILVAELNVPDRWFTRIGTGGAELQKLETSKVDLTGYATKTELSESVENLAQPYDDTVIYSIGDKVIYNDKLYSCLVNMSAAESWDSTHWAQITVASGFVDLDKAQVISGEKTFANNIIFNKGNDGETTWSLEKDTNAIVINAGGSSMYAFQQGRFYPTTSNTKDLGRSNSPWKDGYFGGQVYAQNTYNVINASDISSNTFTADQLAVITNGKPTLISGTFLGGSSMFVYQPILDNYSNYSAFYIKSGSSNYPCEFGLLKISSSTNVATATTLFDLQTSGTAFRVNANQLRNVSYFNQKQVPAYPTTNAGYQVLSIAPNGGALSWENLNGSGTKLYLHEITASGGSGGGTGTLKFISTVATPYTSVSSIPQTASDSTIIRIISGERSNVSTQISYPIAISQAAPYLNIVGLKSDYSTGYAAIMTYSDTITDTVTAL